MRVGVVLACAAVLVAAVAAADVPQVSFASAEEEMRVRVSFAKYAAEYTKTYASDEEYEYRFQVYAESLARIEAHNAGNHSWWMGENAFTDWTWDEFKQHFNFDAPQHCSATGPFYQARGVPTSSDYSWDWRKHGIVSPVKNQGHCGSCWAFSTMGSMEAHARLYTGKPVFLAEQQLVDCAQGFNNNGCRGGLPSQAFEYLHWAGGAMENKDYPYTAKDGKCAFDAKKTAVQVVRSHNITAGSENDLMDAVRHMGPVSIAYQVVKDFKDYKGGVYTSTECKHEASSVNHAVVAVGYENDPSEYGLRYWMVKNSWGNGWGLDGYFLIEKNAKVPNGMCGLATCASFPEIQL